MRPAAKRSGRIGAGEQRVERSASTGSAQAVRPARLTNVAASEPHSEEAAAGARRSVRGQVCRAGGGASGT